MAKKLFTGITIFFDIEVKPIKLRNISSIEKHCKYIEGKYPEAHYTNYYDKEKKSFYKREYHKTKEELFAWLKNRKS